jgi:hypothetical protein
MIHLDWHLGRPGHDHRSFDLPYHWLVAVPAFAPLAWLTLRRWGGAAVSAAASILLLGVLLGQIVEPLSEGGSALSNGLRWRVFAEFIAAGLVSYLLGFTIAARARRNTAGGGGPSNA